MSKINSSVTSNCTFQLGDHRHGAKLQQGDDRSMCAGVLSLCWTAEDHLKHTGISMSVVHLCILILEVFQYFGAFDLERGGQQSIVGTLGLARQCDTADTRVAGEGLDPLSHTLQGIGFGLRKLQALRPVRRQVTLVHGSHPEFTVDHGQ